MEKLKNNLVKICSELTNTLEESIPNYPSGVCYLIGHCMAEGLKKAGYNSSEVTGTMFFKTKTGKNIIYGKSIVKGLNIGLYHTWCVLEINDESIIIDASFKYNKIALKKTFGLKASKETPDFVVTNISNSWLLNYVEDVELINQSKSFLEQVNPYLIEKLIDVVSKKAIEYLGEINNSITN